MVVLSLNKQKLRDLGYIVARNVLLLTNLVIAGVVGLLFFFGDVQAAVFLGLVLVVNVSLGLAQDIRAFLALEHLQILTAPHVTRLRADGAEESVLVEEIKKDDILSLRAGDQVPCDSVLLHVDSLELNEGLITGESTSLPRKKGDRVLAGSVITSGAGTMHVSSVYSESHIARMTEGIKSHAVNQSPIQRAVATTITYSGYVLVLTIIFVTLRGVFSHDAHVLIVKEVGALASTIVPQGLAFAMTLLFAYGAAHLFRRNVLLQEVNATEKLGRIKNLCMDKTGTLTENMLVVERMEVPEGASKDLAEKCVAAYMHGSGDLSQTIVAIKLFSGHPYAGKIAAAVSFSSWRSYGAVHAEIDGTMMRIFAGAPERFLSLVASASERAWLEELIRAEAGQGKRIFVVGHALGDWDTLLLEQVKVALLAVYIFSAKLRPGIREAIDFFQKRRVRIRIISGDHPETVRAIAASAGVNDCDRVIAGSEMEKWTAADFAAEVKNYTIFARTFPEQKEKIIDALKHDGFTAMVGDGANDALAIKKADLGIAMWEGAPATRQIASVVLMNNSFTALPGGVTLADSIIKNAEIFASIFFEFAFAGFFLLVIVSVFGYPYPLSPLNITLINYFTVGIPGILVSYWTIRPAEKSVAPSGKGFLATVLPFTVWSALLQAIALGAVFALSPDAMKTSGSNLYVLVAASVTGFIFFLFTPGVYRGALDAVAVRALGIIAAIEVALFAGLFQIPFLLRFFDVAGELPPLATLSPVLGVILVYTALQYLLAHMFIIRISSVCVSPVS